MRAEGGFGLTMTTAAHVQAIRQGLAEQLGTFADIHVAGLTELASQINGSGSGLHNDPKLLAANPAFAPNHIPVTAAYMANEGLSAPFITSMSG